MIVNLLWGKARPIGRSYISFHPCLYHCLDVAAIGEALLASQPDILDKVCQATGWARAEARTALLFFLTLHDIGKISRIFQSQVPELWPSQLLGKLTTGAIAGPRHDALGLWLLGKLLVDDQHTIFASWRPSLCDTLLAPFVGHHGQPVTRPDMDPALVFGDHCLAAAQQFLATVETIFSVSPLPRPTHAALKRLSWRLAGFAVLCDWLGSNQAWFPYEAPEHDPKCYLEQFARPRAHAALQAAGILAARPSLATGYHTLTGSNQTPSPVQSWAETVALPDGPCLILVEDMTGGGKTEAALILAHRLLASGKAQGLYVALPTMATANAMYERLSTCYRRMFDLQDEPSLTLAHSATRLHEGFQKSVLGADASLALVTDTLAETKGDAAAAACAAWLADSRRKTFLADVGVGTIDQALLAVLPAKHQSLRLFGLANRVLIIDEAHAYDTYMGKELERLLTFQAALGGNAIVLSATLPMVTRQALTAAFTQGLGVPAPSLTKQDYPLVALIHAGDVIETKQAPRPDLPRTLTITRIDTPDEVVGRIKAALAVRAAIAWVRNTVDDAVDAVDRLRAIGIEATLFHARFAMGDRLAIERAIVERFGKTGDPTHRPGVLVATQVVEQSLDLDFDLLISDLAPIDLLLQRAGRLWRHARGQRAIAGPELVVLGPDPKGTIESGWYQAAFPRAAYVYRNHAILWLTADKLFSRPTWQVPEDVRALVQAVYAAEAEERFPRPLQRNWNEAVGAETAAGCIAMANLLDLDKGYGGDHSGWDEDTRTPTRLGEATVTLRLAKSDGNRILPWYDDHDVFRAWALSEVSVRAGRVGATIIPEAHRQAADAVRAGWTRHDANKLLLVLEQTDQGQWQGRILDRKEQPLLVDYHPEQGLQWR